MSGEGSLPMEPDLILKLLDTMEPEELGRLIARMKAQDIPVRGSYNETPSLFGGRSGENGIPLQVSKVRKGVFGGAKNGWAT